MITTMLLDVDIPIYQLAAKAQEENPSWEDGTMQLEVKSIDEVGAELDKHIEYLRRRVGADDVVACLSEPDREKNWRRLVLPTYKNKRPSGVAIPVLREALTQYVANNYEFYLKPTLEGDDVLGILATNRKVIKGTKIIVSADKDLKTIPSREDSHNLMFNPDKDSEPYFNYEWLADWYWMHQTLIGDKTDGYDGLPKCGAVRSLQVLDTPKPGNTVDVLWPKVVAEYEAKGSTESAALIQAQVARICRNEDYNFKTKRAIPWKP